VRRGAPALLAALAAAAVLGGCTGVQSMLDPAGVQAVRTYRLTWFLTIVAAVVFVLVIAAMLYAIFRPRPPAPPPPGRTPPGTSPDPAVERAKERALTRVVVAAIAATVVLLFVFFFVDLTTARAIGSLARGPAADSALTIEITANQWWWDVTYDDPVPARRLRTANEIHLPVGRPVRLKLKSNDVIHSFWVPKLHGKRDLIPGYTSESWLQADEPGVFRGQCAEFCGHQHAKMALLVVAQPPEEFAAWYEGQLLPSVPPADSVAARGQEVFLASACVMCHTIRGTPAGGSVAPELTHLASRRTIAAATLPNTRGHLAGWILDSQRIKPGNKMPPNPLAPDDLQALLTYLQSLQ
jgi:cytochrome c oxidase subunit 2